MRLGLVGDIHGNAKALAAVLQSARHRQIETLCLTGDFVGYYYEPDAVLTLLNDWTTHAVRGNHEDLLEQCRNDPQAAAEYRRRYGSGVDYALRVLDAAQLKYLEQLPRSLLLEFGGKSLLLAHGAPWSTDHYMYADVDPALWDRVAEEGADYVVLGHTHHRFAKRVRDTLVVNPGSVGQPRDRKPGAAWAILDTDTDSVEILNEPYDFEQVAGQARAIDPHLPYLWQVLSRQ
jgi:putative phosphoesterase